MKFVIRGSLDLDRIKSVVPDAKIVQVETTEEVLEEAVDVMRSSEIL